MQPFYKYTLNMSEPAHDHEIDVSLNTLPMFQQKTYEVSFALKHSISKYASIIIDSCAAHLGKFNFQFHVETFWIVIS